METYIQLLIAGISSGSIYGLIALAFLIIYNSTQIVNFAQGEFVMVGGMITFFGLVLQSYSYTATILLMLGFMIIIASLFRYVLVAPLQKKQAPVISIIIGTIVFGIILSESLGLWLGKQQYGVPPLIANIPIKFGQFSILPQNLLIIIISWILVLGIWLFFRFTITGLSLRAISISQEGARISGIRVSRMLTIGFILSAIVSGIGGLLIAPVAGASPYLGLSVAVKGFAAAILGGMGNIYAGMIGGLLIGIIESFSYYYIPGYAEAVAYSVMLLMLFLKPTGLFPEHS